MSSFYTINGIIANPQPGTIVAYLGSTFPDGWMMCDGQQVVTNSFPNLASALGSSNLTNFNVPDLEGLFLRATGTKYSDNVGPPIRNIQQDSFKTHYHSFKYDQSTPSNKGNTAYIVGGNTGSEPFLATGSTETRPYCYGVNWIIKTDLDVSVPGQPTIYGFRGTSATGISVSFTPPQFNSTAVTNYEYSTNGGISWTTRSPASSASPINIPAGSYTSIRLRAINGSGPGQASSVVSLV